MVSGAATAGHVCSRNYGIEAARGEVYRLLLDCDDEWLFGKLDTQLAACARGLRWDWCIRDFEVQF